MQRPARWLGPAIDVPQLNEYARALGISLPAARVLWNRGYRELDAAARFLSPGVDHLLDPLGLTDMDRAVERLARAVASKEKVLLYGDYDVDGTVSIVILKKTLEALGINAEFHVPHRLTEGYGMRSERIDQASRDGVQLIISVDTGIRATAVVEHARSLGIDVIVTDHHLPEQALPPALAVINPNRADSSYGERNLCGAGVTFKLIHALLIRLAWPQARMARFLLSLLKLVALATIADVVPLTGENRVIVRLGLDGFFEVRNHGLRALLDVAGLESGECPGAVQVAFQIAPRINAAGRMADAADVVRMFLTSDADEARRIARQLNDLNQERQQTEKAIVSAIEQECLTIPVTDSDSVLIFAGDNWHKGVVGIVASRLVERYHRPAFVLSRENGTLSGSARSAAGFHLLEALEQMPELFAKFGGHRQAAGVTMAAEALDEFRDRMNRHAAMLLSPEDFCRTHELDATMSLHEINDRSVMEVLGLAPFGCGHPEPLFAIENVQIAGVAKRLGENGALIPIRQGVRTLMVKSWRDDRVHALQPGDFVDLALALQEDNYSLKKGYAGWAATIKDFRPATAGAMAAG